MTPQELMESLTAFEWGLIGLVIVAVWSLITWVSNKMRPDLFPEEPNINIVDTKPPEEQVRPHVRAGTVKDWKRDY